MNTSVINYEEEENAIWDGMMYRQGRGGVGGGGVAHRLKARDGHRDIWRDMSYNDGQVRLSTSERIGDGQR